jgi:hypothetical protein
MADIDQFDQNGVGHLIQLGSLDFSGSNGNGFHANGHALVPEEYARLHADIERASSPARCFVVGVTSAVYGEGKTTVALNLAGTMAQNSQARVTLVDFNLRNWDMQTRLNLPVMAGLVDVLEGSEDDLSAIVQRTELDSTRGGPRVPGCTRRGSRACEKDCACARGLFHRPAAGECRLPFPTFPRPKR